jgi:hypothetical protein
VTQLERDTVAAVEWLAADPWRVFVAQQAHHADAEGLCAAHSRSERWPCFTARLAGFAELLYRERIADRMPEPRSPRDAA